MTDDSKFKFDIENLKKDLAIENMIVTEEDIEMLEKYHNKKISLEELIKNIKLKSIRNF